MTGVLDAIARQAARLRPDPGSAGAEDWLDRVAEGPVGSPKPVLQFVPVPVTLNPALYANARSTANPGGGLLPLRALRDLVDPLPGFSRYYSPSAASTEQTYQTILNGASAGAAGAFATTLLEDARRAFEAASFVNMDGTPGTWRPVYASPDDWCDFSRDDRFHELEVDLGPNQPDGAYDVIGGAVPLRLTVQGRVTGKPLDPTTRIRSVRMRYMLVTFQRPWFNRALFQSAGWLLHGQPSGFCSSGALDANAGVLPLVPAGMLVAKECRLEADFGGTDAGLVTAARSAGAAMSVGPFVLSGARGGGSGGERADAQVIAWISALMPFSPRDSDLVAGSVLVTNTGAFICRFAAAWRQGGRALTSASGNFPTLAAKSIAVPADATEILVTFEVMTFPAPFETWRTVKTLPLTTPARKCFELGGETFNARLTEVACP